MGLFSIFKPAEHIEEIQNQSEVKTLYKYWRIRILYSMFIGYALYYFSRKSFTFAMPGLMKELHFDKAELGILSSILAITYGISKFTSGIMSDKSNPRYFMAFGLLMTGLLNIFFGMSSSLLFFALFWGLNGWFQGFGWPPCARFLTHWYSQSERGSWWSTFNVSHNVGAWTIAWVVGITLAYFGWRMAMYIPGVICILGAFFLINRLRDSPQSLGLPPIEQFRNDYACSPNVGKERELTVKEILFEHVLTNKYIWLLAAAYFFVYFVRQGVNDWTALYLLENKGYTSLIAANGTVSFFEIGGFCGNLAAGWASDHLFGARRGPVIVIFAVLMFLFLALFWLLPTGDTFFWVDGLCMFLIGFAVFGPQMLIGVCAAEFSHKKAAATATGFIGYFAYMGAAAAGYPLGKIAQDFGWNGYFWALAVCCALSAVLLVPIWSVKEVNRTKSQPSLEPEKAKG